MKDIAFVGDLHCNDRTPRSRTDNYFNTVLTKIAEVSKKNNVIIFLGDFMERKVLNTEGYVKLVKVLKYFKREGREFYTIIGNHDIFYGREETLGKTGIGLLSEIGLVSILREVIIEGVYIRGTLQGEEIRNTGEGDRILLEHKFFKEKWKEEGITEEQVKTLNYNYIILGHDHEHESEVRIGGTVVLRPGALLRTTSHNFNLIRNPGYYQFRMDKGRVFDYKYIEVPCNPPEEVFVSSVLHRKRAVFDVESIDDLVQELLNVGGVFRVSFLDCLKEINTPPIIEAKIREIFKELSLTI